MLFSFKKHVLLFELILKIGYLSQTRNRLSLNLAVNVAFGNRNKDLGKFVSITGSVLISFQAPRREY